MRAETSQRSDSGPAVAGVESLLLAAVLLLAGAVGWAQDDLAETGDPDSACVACHDDHPMESPVHAELPCLDCHLGIEAPADEVDGHPEELGYETCDACHARDARTVGRSVHDHEDVTCEACHGTAHVVAAAESFEALVSPTNQVRTCGQCHEDMMDGYLSSEHARALLVSGLVNAPSCTDCHGDGHRIDEADHKGASTAFTDLPETCGECHVGILRVWQTESAHGVAWHDENTDAPVCTTCHSAHEIGRATDGDVRTHYPDQCNSCHGALYTSYRGSFHGQATSLGFETAAICSDCHTPHANLAADDPRSSIHPDNLGATCGGCHEEALENASFLTFDPHSDPTDRARSPQVYYVWLFMTLLLLGVFGFFFAHDLLWLQRALVAMARGEHASRPTGEGPHVRRFGRSQVWTHVTVVVTFLILAATGLPIKFHDAPWAQTLVNLLGGIEVARWLHRVAAIATFGYAAYHLLWILGKAVKGRSRGLFWGPDSLVPQPRDVVDLLRNLRYFLYLGPKPAGTRWGYWEKFDYMAVFWGIPIIGGSGLLLWFPDFFTTFLPGWTLNAAHVVHSDEALLATGFIFVFHFFHTHLRPESFPMDPVIFTGRMPLERFKEERPEEYQALVDTGELESYLVDAPTQSDLRTAYVFGTIALVTGILLAAGIFWALLGQFGP